MSMNNRQTELIFIPLLYIGISCFTLLNINPVNVISLNPKTHRVNFKRTGVKLRRCLLISNLWFRILVDLIETYEK